MGERDNLDNLPVLDGEIMPDDTELGPLRMVVVGGEPSAHMLHVMALERMGIFNERPHGIVIVLENPIRPPEPFHEPLLLRDITPPPVREQEQHWAKDRFGRPHRSRSRRHK